MIKKTLCVVAASSLLFGACARRGAPQEEFSLTSYFDNQKTIETFESQQDMLTFFAANGDGGSGISSFARTEFAEEAVGSFDSKMAIPATAEPQLGGGGEGATDYSTTNIQVEGVDEADLVKSDGEHIYAISESNVHIMKAYPAEEAKVLATITFADQPEGLYLVEDKLVVYGNDWNLFEDDRYSQGGAYVKVIDVANPAAPSVFKEVELEGTYRDSRMVGSQLLFISQKSFYQPYYEFRLPRVQVAGEELELDSFDDGKVHYFDIPYRGVNSMQVATFDIATEETELDREIYFMERGQDIYVSTNHLYITYPTYLDEDLLVFELAVSLLGDELPRDVEERLNTIRNADPILLNREEKLRKQMQEMERWVYSLSQEEQDRLEDRMEKEVEKEMENILKEQEKSVIHKISFKDGELDYLATGEVTGTILNQFSMDEYKGNFRVTTTKNRTWSTFSKNLDQESYNNVYVLDEKMRVIGSLEKLAETERIYSTRFMGDRAYMVTFRQTDPLFVIDLKDPKNPKVLGELKIPGFSNYLHPYDENHLLGIGRDADINRFGGVQADGVKVSLFNVEDVTNPKEVDHIIVQGRGTTSEALNNHKAVLFSKEKNLLAFPITVQKDYSFDAYQGAYLFTVTPEDIAFKGAITHEEGEEVFGAPDLLLTKENNVLPEETVEDPSTDKALDLEEELSAELEEVLDVIAIDEPPVGEPAVSMIAPPERRWPDYQKRIQRLLYIEDILYSLSSTYLQMHDLESLEKQGELVLIRDVQIIPKSVE